MARQNGMGCRQCAEQSQADGLERDFTAVRVLVLSHHRKLEVYCAEEGHLIARFGPEGMERLLDTIPECGCDDPDCPARMAGGRSPEGQPS